MEPEVEETFSGREISFKVKKTMMGRIGKKPEQNQNDLINRSFRKSCFWLSKKFCLLPGWRIMPEDDSLNLKMNKDILNQVLESIKYVMLFVECKM